MTPGRLIAVVGPSGVGKDSVMAGIKAAALRIRLVRRAITRSPDLGGEDHTPLTPGAFRDAADAGEFCLYWQAHGLAYGIPADVLVSLRAGTDCLANLSRSALPQAVAVFPNLVVLQLTASPDTLARRLAARGRESGAEIADRLQEAHKRLPTGLAAVTISNEGALADTVAQALAALYPVRA